MAQREYIKNIITIYIIFRKFFPSKEKEIEISFQIREITRCLLRFKNALTIRRRSTKKALCGMLVIQHLFNTVARNHREHYCWLA